MAVATVDISIEGMTCDHCVQAVSKALKAISGVRDVQVSLAERKARVTYDDTVCKTVDLQTAIQAEGYSSRLYGTDSPVAS